MPDHFTPETHLPFRQLRLAFMQVAMKTGHAALAQIAVTDPDLAQCIKTAFPNPGRAAFWMALEADPDSHRTPLHDLARGARDTVKDRLAHYVSPFHALR